MQSYIQEIYNEQRLILFWILINSAYNEICLMHSGSFQHHRQVRIVASLSYNDFWIDHFVGLLSVLFSSADMVKFSFNRYPEISQIKPVSQLVSVLRSGSFADISLIFKPSFLEYSIPLSIVRFASSIR